MLSPKLFVWTAAGPQPVHRFVDHRAAVKAIAWSPHQVRTVCFMMIDDGNIRLSPCVVHFRSSQTLCLSYYFHSFLFLLSFSSLLSLRFHSYPSKLPLPYYPPMPLDHSSTACLPRAEARQTNASDFGIRSLASRCRPWIPSPKCV